MIVHWGDEERRRKTTPWALIAATCTTEKTSENCKLVKETLNYVPSELLTLLFLRFCYFVSWFFLRIEKSNRMKCPPAGGAICSSQLSAISWLAPDIWPAYTHAYTHAYPQGQCILFCGHQTFSFCRSLFCFSCCVCTELDCIILYLRERER